MKISGFTFLRNAQMLGYPFIESITSILPIVDEFIIALGPCEDRTEIMIRNINSSKIRIIHTTWNENMKDRGYVYGQQKMIAQFNCMGDWAFYLEGDEVVHENDLNKIVDCCKKYKDNNAVEAIAFNYIHFYGNRKSYLDSPSWYRKEARIIKNSIRTYAPDGLFWLVLDKNKIGRYPKAICCDVNIYHYGWVRSEEEMNLKSKKIQKFWGKKHSKIIYENIDQNIIKEFKGTHPIAVQKWLPKEDNVFIANKNYKLTRKDMKNRVLKKIESIFHIDLSKKHFIEIKKQNLQWK